MFNLKELIRVMLLLLFIISAIFIGNTIYETMMISDTTINLSLYASNQDIFYIDDEQSFTLYLSDIMYNDDPSYVCNITETNNGSNFRCSSLYAYDQYIEFNVSKQSGEFKIHSDRCQTG